MVVDFVLNSPLLVRHAALEVVGHAQPVCSLSSGPILSLSAEGRALRSRHVRSPPFFPRAVPRVLPRMSAVSDGPQTDFSPPQCTRLYCGF